MDKFSRFIDSNIKVPYESQISLWVYTIIKTKNLKIKFDEFIMSEQLIDDFNRDIKDLNFRKNLEKMITNNSKVIQAKLDELINTPWEVIKPVVWNNNLNNEYFIKNLTLSHRFEIYIDCEFKNRGIDIGLYYGRYGQHNGECEAGIEIKRDIKSKETGNLYIEYAERHYNNGPWVDSGIFKKDNTKYFLTGNIEEYYILNKQELKNLYEKVEKSNGKLNDGCKVVMAKRGTSKGFIIPKSVASKLSMSLDELVNIMR